jgi:hypothetical protein
MLCASALALATFASGAAFAKTVEVTSTAIDGSDAAVKACTDKGGIVSTAAGGQKSCTTPSAACTTSKINVGTSSGIDTNDEAAVRACFVACGTISTNQAGQTVCTKPGTLELPAPTPSREPHN